MAAKKLLLIDSDRQFAEMLVSGLDPTAMDVNWVSTAEEGAKTALSWQPNAILIDVNLPDSNGFSVFTALKKNKALKQSQFILTGENVPAKTFADHAKLSRHADLYLHKPFTPIQFAQALDDELGLVRSEALAPSEADLFGLDGPQTPAPSGGDEDATLDELDSLLTEVNDPSMMQMADDDEVDLSELDRMLGVETRDAGPDMPPPLPGEAAVETPPPIPLEATDAGEEALAEFPADTPEAIEAPEEFGEPEKPSESEELQEPEELGEAEELEELESLDDLADEPAQAEPQAAAELEELDDILDDMELPSAIAEPSKPSRAEAAPKSAPDPDMERRLKKAEDVARFKNEEVVALVAKVRDIESELEERTEEATRLKMRLKEKDGKASAEKDKQIEALNGALAKLKQEQQQSREHIDALSAQLQDLRMGHKEEIDKLLKDVKRKLDGLKDAHAEESEHKDRKLKEAAERNERLSEQLQQENATLSELRSEFVEARNQWRTERDAFEAQTSELRLDLEKARTEHGETSSTIEESNAAIQALKEERDGLRKQMAALEARLTDNERAHDDALGEREARLADVQADLAAATARAEEAERLAEESRAKRAALEDSVAALTKNLEEAEQRAEQAENSVAAKATEAEEQAARAEALEADLAQAVERVAALEADLDARTAEIGESGEAMQAEIEQLKKQLSELDAANRKNEERVIKAYRKIKADAQMRAKSEKALNIALDIIKARKAALGDGEETIDE